MYTRNGRPIFQKCKIKDAFSLSKSMTHRSIKQIQRTLSKSKLMPTHRTCSRCGGRVRKDAWDGTVYDYGYRCVHKGCQHRMHRYEGHPFFHHGSKMVSPADQLSMLTTLLNLVTLANVHVLLDLPHATVERYAKGLRQHVMRWVQTKQDDIVYGGQEKVMELEVDEVTLGKFRSGNKEKPIAWMSYLEEGRTAFFEAYQVAHQEQCRKVPTARAHYSGPMEAHRKARAGQGQSDDAHR